MTRWYDQRLPNFRHISLLQTAKYWTYNLSIWSHCTYLHDLYLRKFHLFKSLQRWCCFCPEFVKWPVQSTNFHSLYVHLSSFRMRVYLSLLRTYLIGLLSIFEWKWNSQREMKSAQVVSYVFFKMGHSRLLLFIFVFSNKQFLQQIYVKMSIQYSVVGFEHSTFRTRVSSHNH